jgi:acetyltransferase-like isoleucine patch superfamily enzyme
MRELSHKFQNQKLGTSCGKDGKVYKGIIVLIANKNTIRLIGFKDSTITQEAMFFISSEFSGQVEIISPDDFLQSDNKKDYSYLATFTLDKDLRRRIITELYSQNLDSLTYIHSTVTKYFSDENTADHVGSGTFIAPYSCLLSGSKIGQHCIIETYCLLAHHSSIDDRTHLHAGVMIAGKTSIGKNCEFNFKSSVLNGLSICDNIELGAMSCITKNIDLPGKYVGTPARRVGDTPNFMGTEKS